MSKLSKAPAQQGSLFASLPENVAGAPEPERPTPVAGPQEGELTDTASSPAIPAPYATTPDSSRIPGHTDSPLASAPATDTPVPPAHIPGNAGGTSATASATDQATASTRTPDDAAARDAAIDTTRSILVQAPAGAGKTSLLTARYLALLATVEEPEQILAITFTRAATAEMLHRILGSLEAAASHPEPVPNEAAELALARTALAHAHHRGWHLLEQPHRLDVQTIDSLCLRLAHAQPLLARLGGALQPTEDAEALYNTAARRTVALLGSAGEPEFHNALALLLLRRDNSLPDCEKLIAGMLSKRDSWLGLLPLGSADSVDWDQVRSRLEAPFAREQQLVLSSLQSTFQSLVADAPSLLPNLLHAARYASANLDGAGDEAAITANSLGALRDITELPGTASDDLAPWLALATLLLTAGNGWRKSWDYRQGFLPTSTPGLPKTEKVQRRHLSDQIQRCSQTMQSHSAGAQLLALFCRLRSLPAAHYSADQWHTLRAIFLVLRHAVAELRLLFAETNSVDFPEIAQAAESVLRDSTSMRGLLESEGKQHILIDEFQDTSRTQYRLVAELLREWSEGDGRTVFVVGDPLQSIYGFRQAEVALFHDARHRGLPCGDDRRHPCHPLQLTHNFRSHRALVEELNGFFAQIFPEETTSDTDQFVPATAWEQPVDEPSLQIHSFVQDQDQNQDQNQHEDATFRTSALAGSPAAPNPAEQEADTIIRILQSELPRIVAAEAAGASEYRVALLVRSRTHLRRILPRMREAHIPFRAVDLEPLADQPEVHDLHMLLRALLHPGERVAWLTVLRAPWCGLTLSDLHRLTGGDNSAVLARSVPARIAEVLAQPETLSPDGAQRLARSWVALEAALHTRYAEDNNLSLSASVERTWMALGGPACVSPTARQNVESFFRLLDELDPSGVEVLRGDFALRIARLCAAPDTRTSERFGIQLMTMHKSKGLGFEVVLLPGLERVSQSHSSDLLAMLQRTATSAQNSLEEPGSELPDTPSPDTLPNTPQDELLLAPIGSREEDTDATYGWVRGQVAARESAERKRLFYVACTRARQRLHLFATVEVCRGELRKPDAKSLLAAAWPALAPTLQARVDRYLARRPEAPAAEAAAIPMPASLTLAASAELAKFIQVVGPLESDRSVNADRASESTAASPLLIARLPLHRSTPGPAADLSFAVPSAPRSARTPALYLRGAEGSIAARARGTALHALLEWLTLRLAAKPDESSNAPATPRSLDPFREPLEHLARRHLQSSGLPPGSSLASAARELARIALRAAASPSGRWLLHPHPGARSEVSWQLWEGEGTLRTIRMDRCFLAGDEPGTLGNSCFWIIDYKTGTHTLANAEDRAAWVAAQRALYGAQLEAYGLTLAASGSITQPIHYALFFPEINELIAWSPGDEP